MYSHIMRYDYKRAIENEVIGVDANPKIIELLEKQIEIEKKAIEINEKIAEESESPLIRYLLLGTCHDSMKHQNFCLALIDILSGKELLVRERVEIEKLIGIDDEIEEEMRENLNQIIKLTTNRAAKLILHEYQEDEKRHQNLLKQLKNSDFRDERLEDILLLASTYSGTMPR